MTTLPACRSFPPGAGRRPASCACSSWARRGRPAPSPGAMMTFTGPRLSPILWRGHPIGLGVLETVRQIRDGPSS